MNSKPKNYICTHTDCLNQCEGFIIYNENSMSSHIPIHSCFFKELNYDQDEIYICSDCNQIFSSNHEYNLHIQKEHKKFIPEINQNEKFSTILSQISKFLWKNNSSEVRIIKSFSLEY